MPEHVQGHVSGQFRPGMLLSGTAPVVVVETAPVFDPATKGTTATLTNSNTTISTSFASWTSARSVLSKNSGKWHAELQIGTIDAASSVLFGLCSATADLNTYLGNQSRNDYMLQGNARGSIFYWNSDGQFVVSGVTVASVGQKAMVTVDFDAGKVWLGINGTYHNSGNPVAGTNATVTFTAGTTLYLAASVYGTSTGTLVVPAYTPTGFTNFA